MLNKTAETKSLKQMLDAASAITDDGDRAFICATALNLYVECNRRIHNRNLMSAGDFISVMKIIDILFGELAEPIISQRNPGTLTKEQEEKLLKGVEEGLNVN